MSQGYLAPLYSDKDDQEAARVSGRPGCVRHGGWPVVARRIRRVGSNLYHNSAVLVLVQSLLGHYAHRTLARRPSWTMSANRVLKCHDNEICLAGTLDCTWLYALEGLAFSHASGAEGQRITVLPGPLDHSSCGGSGRAVQSQSHRPIGAAGHSRARSSPAHKSLSSDVCLFA